MVELKELEGWLERVTEWRNELGTEMETRADQDAEDRDKDTLFWMVESLQIGIEEVMQEME